jgi:ketose-bisphosphate aldolase
MKLVNTVSLLRDAKKNGYAVPAINVDQIDSVIGVLSACQKTKSPVIIQLSPIQVHTKGIGYQAMVQMVKSIGEEFDVEMAIHLDHGTEIEDVKAAIDGGFTSVMYDGSKENFKKNIEGTAKIVSASKGISVEGELGILQGEEGKNSETTERVDHYTDVKQAVEFVKNTGVDFLAVAIGNAHGIYTQTPKLNFERLKELNEVLDIPLVLHGASGLSKDDIKKAISLGICKINFFTDIDRKYMHGIAEELKKEPNIYSFMCLHKASNSVEKKIIDVINMCGSANKGER